MLRIYALTLHNFDCLNALFKCLLNSALSQNSSQRIDVGVQGLTKISEIFRTYTEILWY